jgi:acetylornithine aminotransferase/acetylornithine/N-succinyldiaminopimelate aminotransferase
LRSFDEYVELEKSHHFPTYSRFPVLFVKGKGTRLWDIEGKEYIDFLSGIGVVSVGHSHPRILKALERQARSLIHISNLFYIASEIELAKKLSEISINGKCFFANSGAEANECAIKLARKYFRNKGEERYEVITAYRSFHGRTLKTLAATGQESKKKDFEPLPPGFKHVPLNDIEALKREITSKTCAIMLEVIQGEGGIYPCEERYLREVREVCDKSGLLLILDEVQTGMGRTGKLFAYEWFDVNPDILTLAKGLGAGFPIGAVIAHSEVSDAFSPGDHGSTFGGNPLACAVSLEVLNIIREEGLVENAQKEGAYLLQRIKELSSKFDFINEVRGRGLMIGMHFKKPIAKEVVVKLLHEGIVAGAAGNEVLRFLPPLCIKREEIDILIEKLAKILQRGSYA